MFTHDLDVGHQENPGAVQIQFPQESLLLGHSAGIVAHALVVGHQVVPATKPVHIPQVSLPAQQLGISTHKFCSAHQLFPVGQIHLPQSS